MNLIIWQYIVWGILAIIIIGVLFLSYALINDYRKSKERTTSTVGLPSLNPEERKAEAVKTQVFEEGSGELASGTGKTSRRGLRKEAEVKDYQEANAKKSSAFFEDDDEEFTLPGGKD